MLPARPIKTFSLKPKSPFEVTKALLIPALLAVLGFLLGILAERLKDASADEKAAIDARVAVYAATVENLPLYLAHASRLRSIANIEHNVKAALEKKRDEVARASFPAPRSANALVHLDKLKAEKASLEDFVAWISKRKEVYVLKRDEGHDKLSAQFFAAALHFGTPTAIAMKRFQEFDRTEDESKPFDRTAWQRHTDSVIAAMREEIKNEQQKRRSEGFFSRAGRVFWN
jgi:hypothetical protein